MDTAVNAAVPISKDRSPAKSDQQLQDSRGFLRKPRLFCVQKAGSGRCRAAACQEETEETPFAREIVSLLGFG
ncbi:MAG: hypothetical protein J5633_03835 [Oscillospiraceae bacterium]|nr:hypothetical protein [Oscillospiraceae bacterium]